MKDRRTKNDHLLLVKPATVKTEAKVIPIKRGKSPGRHGSQCNECGGNIDEGGYCTGCHTYHKQ